MAELVASPQQVAEVYQPSMRNLWTFFWPLAISDITLSVIHPVVMSGLARSTDATYNLTVYGTAISIVVLLESPVIMLMHTANALAHDVTRFRVIRNYMLMLVAISLLILVFLGYTSPGTFVLQELMGLTPALASDTADFLRLFTIWPLLLGWARLCQGTLIYLEQTTIIGIGTLIRLLATFLYIPMAFTLTGEFTLQDANMALTLAIAAEGLLVSLFVIKAIRNGKLPAHAFAPLSVKQVHIFHMPLLFTTLVMVITRPAMIAGLARLPDAEITIAVWSIVYTVGLLFSNHGRSFLNMVITLANSKQTFARIAQFGWIVGIVSSVLLVLIGATPLGDWFLGSAMGIEESLITPVKLGLIIIGILPLLRVFQNRARGALIRIGTTSLVNQIALVNVAVMIVGAALIALFQLPGVIGAPLVFLLSYIAEVVLLETTLQRRNLPALFINLKVEAS